MSPQLVLLLFLLASGAERADRVAVRLDLIDAPGMQGELESITPDRLRLLTGAGPTVVELADVLRIQNLNAPAPADRSVDPPRHSLLLLRNGCLRGRILPAPDKKMGGFAFDVGWAGPLFIPLDALNAVRFGERMDGPAERELEVRLAERTRDRDLLIVPKGGQVTVFPGALDGLDEERWHFTIGKRQQSAGHAGAYAVVFATSPRPKAQAPDRVRLPGDQFLAGKIVSADAKSMKVDCGPLGSIGVPWTMVESVDRASERVVSMSDLFPVRTVARTFFDDNWPPRVDRSVGGQILRLRGVSYERGLGVHAYTALTYRLEGRFERFAAIIGIDDAVAPHGSVVFRVILDGRTAFESACLRGDQPPVPISVDVSGVKEMTLECDPAEELDISDHADWGDALLVRPRSGTIR